MTDERPALTRRRVLAGLGTAGAFGTIATGGTLAVLSDDEGFDGQVQAGRVVISTDCDGCAVEDGSVAMAFDELEPGDEGTERIRLRVGETSNPVRPWLRTACPPAVDPLGEALEARLWISPGCGGERTFPLGDGWVSFDRLRRALRDGQQLGDRSDPCFAPGEVLCLGFDYRLPEEAAWTVEAETGLGLELVGQQCRDASDATVDDPFADVACPTVECSSCVELGTFEVADDRIEPDRVYAVDELSGPFAADGHEYELEALTVTDKTDEGERETVCAGFRLLRDGSETDAPPICEVAVGGGGKSGGGNKQDRSRPDRARYEVDPPLTRTRGEVCAAHDEANPENAEDGQRPAISNVSVFVCADEEVSADG